jgi:tetratricopeptide (TPR) repeat protein
MINKVNNMSYKRFLPIVLTLLLLASGQYLFSQKSTIFSYENKDFYKGLELFGKEKYGAAKNIFEEYIQDASFGKSELKAEAQYYTAMCAIELYNLDAEYLVFKFVNENPENPLQNSAYFSLADYMYKKKNYPKTISYYNLVDRYFLNEQQLSEYYFQKGYSYYKNNDFKEARVCFYEIKDIESKYSSPALYYYSHIAYDQENYQTALEGFQRLLSDDSFSAIAPYYVAQIYYMQKKFQDVIDFAPPLMDEVAKSRSAEMSKIIGESYFYLGRYEEAIPYLQAYRDEIVRISIEDKYQLAYAYYMSGDYDNAATYFERISLTNTEISQSALYHLGDCYLKLDEKNKARSAFASAARMDFNQNIKEDALFNYAKATYELSYSPFNEAVRAFNNYISQYPASDRTDEAYNFLVMAYMNTKNYRMALESLEKIKDKDNQIQKAYQKVSFYRGIELFTNQRYNDAISVFDKSLKYGQHDQIIKARSYYWLAESYYNEGDNETAEDFYDLFLNEPSSFQTPEYKMVNYSKGYIAFSEKNYTDAKKWFQKYVNLEKSGDAVSLSDAYNRLADCEFIQSNYWQAITFYDKVIELKKADVDYAYFQKGFSLGLVDKPERKLETMSELIKLYPSSAYIDDALYEIGRTRVLLNKPVEAQKAYAELVEKFPGSTYLSKTLVQMGLIANNAGRNQDALSYYKRVVNDYPGTTKSSNALKSIKDIYVNLNNVDGYLAYVEEIGQGVSASEQDSLVYTAAENAYLEGNCDKAIPQLENYIQKYPYGVFLLNANYYYADCLLKSDRGEDAFQSLLFIIDQGNSMFTEPSLVAASRIAYRNGDYNQAAGLYQKLIKSGENKANISEAQTGLMRSYYQLGEYANTIEAANEVLIQDKPDPQIIKEAKYLMAKSYLKQNDTPAAYDWFSQIANEVNSEYGAEAKYYMAEISYQRGDLDKTESIIFEFIDMNTPHEYWMGKSFILLSDVYLAKNDDFQAVQTLESVINYYTHDDDGIKVEAIQKKKSITERVNEENTPADRAELEINMGTPEKY